MIVALFLSMAAQTSSHRLPPAGPLPAPTAQDEAVMQPVNAIFEGIAERNPAKIAAQVLPGGSATSVSQQSDGSRTVQRLTWSELLARLQPGSDKFEERLSDPAIDTDGNVATVWGNYVFLINGKVHHCGIDHFSLVRENGAWKIADLSWSQRLTGCPGQ